MSMCAILTMQNASTTWWLLAN